MSYPEYEQDVLRTLSLKFNLQDEPGGPYPRSSDLEAALQKAITVGHLVDQLKRSIFYGSEYNEVQDELDSVTLHVGSESEPSAYPSPAMLHSAMGVLTEAAEFLEAIVASMFKGEEFDRTNAIEELGDLEWYMAVMRNRLGISQEKVQRINIAKLRARYPDKFQSGEAIDRDQDRERTILESAAK